VFVYFVFWATKEKMFPFLPTVNHVTSGHPGIDIQLLHIDDKLLPGPSFSLCGMIGGSVGGLNDPPKKAQHWSLN